jgi:Ice-binding-like
LNSKRGKVILIVCVSIVVSLAIQSDCSALPVDLGAAGPEYWAVLETGTGTIVQSQSGKSAGRKKHAAASAPASQGGVIGNVGIANYSSNYSFASVSDSPQSGLDQARRDASAASAAATGLSATSALKQINLKGKSVTLDAGVYNLTNLQLNRATLTLSGSGSFVFNISSVFALKSARVLLAGGATEANVLFNYTGSRGVTLSKLGRRGSASVLHGIILALNARVNLNPGLVVGEIISGSDISMSSSSSITNLATRVARVPEGTSTFVLSLIALCALSAFRSLAVYSSRRRAGSCR